MRKVLMAVFGPTAEIERTLGGSESVEVLACPAAIDDLMRLDPVYDAILVMFDPKDHPWEERDAQARSVDYVNTNLVFRLKGGSRPLWL